MIPIARILATTNWCLVFIAILIYLLIFILVFKCRRELRDISLLLTCVTCISAFLTCLTACVMISSNLFSGFLSSNMIFCYTWGLFYDICECSIYFSYCLQAFYRLCRVVFYKKKYLLSYYLYLILILAQSLLIIILLVPPVFMNWYIRLPTETYCLIPYTYIGPEIYHILLLYLIPLVSLGIIYIWITTDIRNTSQALSLAVVALRRQRNQRDLVVIKRILVLLLVLIVLRFPTIIFMIYGAIVGSLYSLTYAIVGMITSICLIFIGLITIKTTSQLQKQFLELFFNRVQIEPMPLNQLDNRLAAVANRNSFQQSKRANTPLEENTL